MFNYLLKKISMLIITLLLVSFIAFFVFQIIPGDPVTAILGTEYTPERAAELRDNLGLNKPVMVRYINWFSDFIHGDMGNSYHYNMPVSEVLASKFPVSVSLAVLSFVIIVIISIPLGLIAAKYGNKRVGRAFDLLNQVTMAIPSFFLGILIILVFGLILRWFNPGNYIDYTENFSGFIFYLIPAAFAIAIPKIAMVVKFIKNGVMSQLKLDYVRTAYSKGNTENAVLVRHVLKNALIPVITMLGMIAAEILAGSIVVEQVFNLPGIGRILVRAIGNRDYPIVQVLVVYIATAVIVINFIVDTLYEIIDPRVTSGIQEQGIR